MRTTKSLLFLLACCFYASVASAGAQVSEHAIGDARHLYGGVEGSDFNPDYSFNRIYGIGFFADYMISRYLGGEAEIRLLALNKPAGLTEKTYLAGPIFDFYRYHRFIAFGKILAGAGSVTYPDGIGYGSYFAFAPGGGVDYRLNQRVTIRGEYVHDFFPSAPGFPNFPSNGLTPRGYSAGVSYRFY